MTPELHFEIFGGFAPNAKVDMKELILAGHSYGAATMIATDSVMKDEAQPRALLLMDPWCMGISKEVLDGTIRAKCPLIMMHSDGYHNTIKNFDSWGCI